MRMQSATTGLVAVTIAAGGFAGAVQVQKHRGTEVAGGAPVGMPASFTGGPPGGGTTQAGGDAATTGTGKYTDGDVIYVEGNTVKVKVRSRADVSRTASADSDEIEPGDSVVVQGAANSNGTVTATSVTATEMQPEE